MPICGKSKVCKKRKGFLIIGTLIVVWESRSDFLAFQCHLRPTPFKLPKMTQIENVDLKRC